MFRAAVRASAAAVVGLTLWRVARRRATTFAARRVRKPRGGGAAPVVLFAGGSYSPVTNAHVRMLELARERALADGDDVVAGVASPVHGGYGKKSLVPAGDRYSMLRLAVRGSDWVSASQWETRRPRWSNTSTALAGAEEEAAAVLRAEHGHEGPPPRAVLVCGSDLLESMVDLPLVWPDADVAAILGRHGAIVLQRRASPGQPPARDADDLMRHERLVAYRDRVRVVRPGRLDMTSSTMVRALIADGRYGEAAEHLPPGVLDYIRARRLYGASP